MLNVVVTDPPRADLAQVDKLATYGTEYITAAEYARRAGEGAS